MLEIKHLNIKYGHHCVIEDAGLTFPIGLTCLTGASG